MMEKKIYSKISAVCAVIAWSLLATGVSVNAQNIGASGLLSNFDSSWTQFQANGFAEDGIIEPGVGGQEFDAEYLLYKLEGNTLSLGLQAGFDLVDGKVIHGGKSYYSGDLALSFDGNASSGNPSSYEYAVDFGLYTEDYDGDKVDAGSGTGIDTTGVYKNVGWNSDIYYANSSPFAMDDGELIAGALKSSTSGSGESTSGITSYYRIIALDLGQILGDDWAQAGFILDPHWIMSCGNDVIDGSLTVTPAPEPATMLLFGAGLIGLGGVIRKRKKNS